MTDEIELTSEECPTSEFLDSMSKTACIKTVNGDLVIRYKQTIEFGEVLTDDDLALAQESMNYAQKVFLLSLKGTY